ncbi:DNA-binding transcriptional response regulator, NtrC family, contains REC, AAA-type ATPase, and a Fis-type DNA-binding domains [Filimonas lacunae]|uniref:DNA-binding transcriptional response regulator, NtrC family, contains REC, AAA-type ATPase, and a Fis-type DNA-binding domains n=1 Tax=Filimonas lacunae TaxID=477680 RepID=A0A173MG66_9BACT|nr:sigma-54 dependent transcriptional regulator [Filimonas lacunae]BAV06585.1 formate hydrogenlyase transcriptional activator [Filimonas lacunae]SIT27481.1 DNA-binding transcriptional response regulator, NtrC family, contains REC, AAA-type ATPase, and a Fis-type DNA-binding domains [Filimonas lacunae]
MIQKEKILIVEDEFIVANDLRLMLHKAGYQPCGIASSVEQARQLVATQSPDWVLLDIMLKGSLTGIDLARELMQQKIPFLFISANTNQSILEAAKATHPYGFLVKPFRERDLFVMLDIARYRYQTETAQVQQRPAVNRVNDIPGIIGENAALIDVIEKIKIVAPVTTSVLILGESGTGKEKVAQSIHQYSNRKAGPFVTINCAALPVSLVEAELFGHEKGAFTGAVQQRAGKFEQAHGGTIFLDEIGELPLDAQVKLLRVLQEKEVERLGSDTVIKTDVRVVAATNRQLEKEVAEGRFRLDLYYRLNVFPIELPALRKRKDDLEALTYHFIRKYGPASPMKVNSISAAALAQLQGYHWPGNVRELEHLIERHVLLAYTNCIEEVNLPQMAEPEYTLDNGPVKTLKEIETEHILNTLKACKGKVYGPGGAAEVLRIPAATLYSKMKKLGIKQDFF